MIDFIKELKNKQVKITYLSQNKIIFELEDKRRIEVSTDLDFTSYDDVAAFLDYEELEPWPPTLAS